MANITQIFDKQLILFKFYFRLIFYNHNFLSIFYVSLNNSQIFADLLWF